MKMNFHELVEFTYSNPQHVELMNEIMTFGHRIDKKLIAIERRKGYGSYDYGYSKIVFMDLKLTKKFLQTLCGPVTKIKYSSEGFEKKENEELVKLIIQHCSNLEEIDISLELNNLLTKPFKKVKVVQLSGLASENLELSKFYPNMEVLRMGDIQSVENIIKKYPHLREVSFESRLHEKIVEDLVKINRIDTIDIRIYPTFGFLQKVSSFSNVRALKISVDKSVLEESVHDWIHFNNIENLEFRFLLESSEIDEYCPLLVGSLQIVFDKLKSFTLWDDSGYSVDSPHWLQLIPNYKELTEIRAPFSSLSAQNLREYKQKCPNLEFVESFEISEFESDDPDNNFIKNLAHTTIPKIKITKVPKYQCEEMVKADSLKHIKIEASAFPWDNKFFTVLIQSKNERSRVSVD